MGNYNQRFYYDYYTSLDNKQIEQIRSKYKIIDVDYLNYNIVHNAILADDYFSKSPLKKNIINKMLDYYLKHPDKNIYQKTDYLCNKKERICICNIHANDLRKIFDKNNFKEDVKYISWFKCSETRFPPLSTVYYYKNIINLMVG
jgi:hypothetical protein